MEETINDSNPEEEEEEIVIDDESSAAVCIRPRLRRDGRGGVFGARRRGTSEWLGGDMGSEARRRGSGCGRGGGGGGRNCPRFLFRRGRGVG